MAWTPESLKLPILTPGQMNPYNQALSSGLDTYQNMMKSAYEPQKLQADIASKAAYATYSPYGSLAKIFENPLAFAALASNPANLKAVMDKMSNIPTNPLQSIQNNQGGGGILGQVVDHVKSSLGIGGSNPSANVNQDSGSPAPGRQFGANDPASPAMVQDIANNGNNAYHNNSSNVPQGTSTTSTSNISRDPNGVPNTGVNDPVPTTQASSPATMSPEQIRAQAYITAFPNSPEAIRAKTQQKAALGDADAQNKLWKERLGKEGAAVDDVQKSITTLDTMKAIYPKLAELEKGVIFGRVPAVSDAAKTFDTLAKNQASTNIRALQSGHITNSDFQIADQLKPSRTMNADSFNTMEEFNQALNVRSKERQKFDAQAKKAGWQIQDADSAWSKFISEKPIFDPSTQRVIKQNVNVSPFNDDSKFNPLSILDYKFKDPAEFKASFNALNPTQQAYVSAEMKRRGWH